MAQAKSGSISLDMNPGTLPPQVRERNPIRRCCLAASLLIVLSLFTCGPAFAAKFEKTFDKVRIESDAPGVEITILDYFGHPVESAVVRLQGRIPPSVGRSLGLGVLRGIRQTSGRDFEIVKIEKVKEGHFTYRVKYNGLFEVQVRDLGEGELYHVETRAAEKLAEELAQQIRRQRGF